MDTSHSDGIFLWVRCFCYPTRSMLFSKLTRMHSNDIEPYLRFGLWFGLLGRSTVRNFGCLGCPRCLPYFLTPLDRWLSRRGRAVRFSH